MKKTPFKYLATLLILLQLTSCGFKAGPDNGSLAISDRQEIAAWASGEESVQASSLFSLLNSEQLRFLVNEAMAANPGLQQTSLSLKIAETALRQKDSLRMVQADAELSASKEKDNEENFTGSLAVSWAVDLWGKLSDDAAAAEMNVAEQQSLLDSARDTLAVEVMKCWLQLIAESHSVEIQQGMLETLEKNEKYILERYRSGLGTLEDLDSARSTSASARSTLVKYLETGNRLQRTLKVLLGKTGPLALEIPENYPVVLAPLAELPAQTLECRPDLKAAYYGILSADLQASVAYKELLPEINLSAALQDISSSPSSLLLSDPLWALLGQLITPVFSGGRLQAAADEADLYASKKYQEYRETLLTAVQEVENGLGYEREFDRRINHIESALFSARNSLASYKQSYRTGLVDILDLLTVQKKTYELELEFDNLLYNRLANRIDLGLALGLGVEKQ